MIETTYTHTSRSDGLPLAVLRIAPDNGEEIRGVVQFVHGKNEHKGRYAEVMRYFASNGYLTVIHDHRGHGESVRRPEDRGYLYEAGTKAFVEDMYDITQEVKAYARETYGRSDLPFHMIAHSMGSLAARCYLCEHDTELDHLCIVGSPSWTWGAVPGFLMVKTLKAFEGGESRSMLADQLIMRNSYAQLDKLEGLHNAWTNSDREAVIEKNNDPLCRFKFTLDGFETMVGLSVVAYAKRFKAQNPGLKIRFFSGEDDPCMRSPREHRQSRRVLRQHGYRNISEKLYEGMRHDILNEREKERVFEDMLRFIRDEREPLSRRTRRKS